MFHALLGSLDFFLRGEGTEGFQGKNCQDCLFWWQCREWLREGRLREEVKETSNCNSSGEGL